MVAISKGHPASAIRAVAALGQRDFGENYLQEALPKLQELQDLKLTWHYTPPLNICVQVSLVPEPGKGGVPPEQVLSLAQSVAALPKLKLRGLMCIPPPRDSFDEQRALFEQLVACQRQLLDAGLAVDTLSMGMSDDLEAAVAAGATWVRIGTAIFGKRAAR